MPADPAGQFHRADIVALAVMGAALGNQNGIAVLHGFQCGCPAHGLDQITLVPGKEN